jgi:proteasome assembly chaperone (PAC2) family protein
VEGDIWIERFDTPKLKEPVAVVGSPGLRSIGKLAVDSLIAQTNAQLTAELYSTHLPSIHQTTPSYAADPALPGMAGAIIEAGRPDLPKVQFYACAKPALIFARGYHANFAGQFTVAQKVVDFLSGMGVKRMIVVAGYGTKDKKICCAANTQKALDGMKTKYDIGIGYKGPFMGFSGLVFGLSTMKGMESVCLFSGTQPVQEDLELPDKEASDRAVALLGIMLGLQKP